MAQKIITLTDREKCRLRLPVFFGTFDSRDIAFIEAIMNARDELVNHCDWDGEINIALSDDCLALSIEDNGRGIPLSGDDENGEPNYVKIFETLFAGCNFENSFSDNVIETIGQNGVGVTTTNFCSKYYQAIQYKNKIAHQVTYKNGALEREYIEYKADKEHGTKVTFELDDTVFTDVVFSPLFLKDYINKISSTTPNIRYTFAHKGEVAEFNYETYEEYFDHIINNSLSKTINLSEKTFEKECVKEGKAFIERDRIQALISLSSEPVQETFLNGGYLPEYGTFYTGLIDGLRKVFQSNVDKKTKLTPDDIKMSFNIYATMGSNNPVYSNQTKKAASNELYKKIAADYIVEHMEIVKIEQPQLFEQMLKHLVNINSFNTKNEASRKKIKKALEEKATNATTRPAKLVPCRSKNPNEIELILIEGDSALNSIKLGRNADTMMIYPLKGKPLNALKKGIDAIMENAEILDIFKILGCGITYKGKKTKGFPEFNIDNLSVRSLTIATDFDEDGYHIQAILITLFYVLAPELLKQGKIQFLETPLYVINSGKNQYYAYSENERNEIVASLKSFKETRYKGLGGLPVQTMSKCLAPETRRVKVVTMEDAKACMDKIELFMSDNTLEDRKLYIEEHGHKFVNTNLLV